MFSTDSLHLPSRFSCILLALVSCYVVAKLVQRISQLFRLPRGPFGLPLFGYIPFIRTDFVSTFNDLAKKYGPVFSLNMYKYDYVVLNDYQHIREALSKEDLLARPPEGLFGGFFKDKGIVDASGQDWREQRRTALHLLRDVGLMKTPMEEAIVEEMTCLTEELDKHVGKPYQSKDLLKKSTSNNICSLVYGKRFGYDDAEKIKLDKYLAGVNEEVNFFGITAVMPFLVHVLSFLGFKNYVNFIESIGFVHKFNVNQIKMHRKANYEHKPDFIDKYLEKIDEAGNPSKPPFDLETLNRNLFILFAAGSATITSTLTWGLLLLTKFPVYQEKIRREIEENVGSRKASYDDRTSLPLLQAFIYEILRYRTIIPINLLRMSTRDVKVGNYLIPKGCPVLMNFYAVDHDPSLWEEPDKFYPERFLSADGKLVIPSHFFPFGAGRRNCIGEGMAKVELFHYFLTLIRRYDVQAEHGPASVSDEPKFGFGINPKHFPSVILKPVA